MEEEKEYGNIIGVTTEDAALANARESLAAMFPRVCAAANSLEPRVRAVFGMLLALGPIFGNVEEQAREPLNELEFDEDEPALGTAGDPIDAALTTVREAYQLSAEIDALEASRA